MANARVNWAENMLLSHGVAKSSTKAVICCTEEDPEKSEEEKLGSTLLKSLTFEELYQEVAEAAAGLRRLGVGPGDTVAAYTPNNAEAIVMVLATSSLGAIWTSSPPEFGVTGVLDRFSQLRPKVLLSADYYRAAGKVFSVLSKLSEITCGLKEHGLETVILVGQLSRDRRPQDTLPNFDGVISLAYPDFLDSSANEIDFWRGPGNAPLWVLYSSGTTGKPKAIIHNSLGMVFAMKMTGKLHNSAGAPLPSAIYAYVRNYIKHVFIHNGSGGTDVCASFMGGCTVLPIYAGVIQVPYLGFAIEAAGEDGQKLTEGLGDLVIARPAPNMPLGLVGDDKEKTKFRETYFNHYSSRCIWYHADYVEIDKHGGIIMHGRSDGVLNPQGVRFGSAELYSVIEQFTEINDCIAIGQKTPDGDERVVLFVKMRPPRHLDADVIDRIKRLISTNLSRRHVPAKILECPDIPYTATAKRVEVAVKKLVNGADVRSLNTNGLANPESLDFFCDHPELRFSDA
ncbi:MAG: acetoacetyl-CoA synthetase [Cyphobasidiales sp. Tagirdzhanova-0007]|nr:MAG: acetoacetyl-CoA synthetase [Cyphobasidiales sp. Tagirdzhanova-0007]